MSRYASEERLKNYTTIYRREWVWVIGCCLVLLIITGLPYIYGAFNSSSSQHFSGFMIGVEDGNSYLAKMQQGRSGYWLFKLTYTPEPHQGEPFFFYYILLGKVAKLIQLSNPFVLHLSRLLTIPFGVVSFYYFAAYFLETIKARRLASLIFCFTGGLGWLWLLLGGASELGRMPVDVWVPDASFFLSALIFPHLPLAQGLLLLFCVTGLKFITYGKKWMGLTAAACGVIVSFIHPHTVPVMGLLLGLYSLWQYHHNPKILFRSWIRLGLISLPSLPYLLYIFTVFYRNPAFVAWRLQSLTYSPAPVYYLLGFGFTLLFAVIGVILTWRLTNSAYRFLYVWIISVPILVYIPMALQRRFLDGYQAPLAVMAAVGLLWLLKKIHRRWRSISMVLILTVMSLTNVLLVTGAMAAISQPHPPTFISVAQVKAGQWLAQQPPQAVVLTSLPTGNYLPAVADVRVFVGHGPETIASAEKIQQIEMFFSQTTDNSWRLALLDQFDVTYVYHGPAERALGNFAPAEARYLQQVYDNDSVQIYQVILP